MRMGIVIGAGLLGATLWANAPAVGQSARAEAATPPTDLSAQARQRARRAPTRVTVSPTRKLVRACSAWYALEHRPSGDVITPQMRCWWTVQ